MGFFDNLRFETGLPEFGLPPETQYQTKALFRTMAKLSVNREEAVERAPGTLRPVRPSRRVAAA